MAAASLTWRTNQSGGLWDAGDSPTQQQQQQQSFFDKAKLKPSRNASNSSYSDSNGDSANELVSHDWELGSEEEDDDQAQEEDNLVAQVSQLISRMFDADDQFQSDDSGDNNREAEHEADEDEKTQDTAAIGSESRSNARSSRERFLQTKLAQVLIELSAEQENLHFAASAGKELLEQLSDAKDEAYDLRSQLHACQQQLGLAKSEKTRLQDQQSVMERELMHFRESWTELHAKSSNNTSSSGSQGCGENPPWLETSTSKETDQESCHICPQRSEDLKAALNEKNELKRRCLELEIQHGKQCLSFEELQQRHEMLQTTMKKAEVRYDQSQRDVEYVNAQIKQFKLDHQDTVAARDHLRMTTRRLQSENDNLVQKLGDRDTLISYLQSEKRATGTNTQVLENRVSSLQLENQTLLLALAESQQQLNTEKQRQTTFELHGFDHEDQHGEGAISLQQHASDLEHLFNEAQRDLVALKVENKFLRRQQHQIRANDNQTAQVTTATFRRTKSLTTTCADILAVDEALLLLRDVKEVDTNQHTQWWSLGLQLEKHDVTDTQSTPHPSYHSRFEAAAVSPIQTVEEYDMADRQPTARQVEELEVADHRSTPHQVPRSSFQVAAVSPIHTTATTDLPAAPASAPSASPTFLQSVATRRRHTLADSIGEKENIRERERMRRSTVSTLLPSASAGEAQQTGNTRPAAKSPLYLGLSVIACATAAAGLLSRR